MPALFAFLVPRLLSLAMLLLLSSCGYHFSGTGAIVPEGMNTLAVPVFFNATGEPYVDVELTQAVIEEFMTDGRLRIVGPEQAQLVLNGRIVRFELTPLSYNPQSFVQQYRVRLVVEAVLEDVSAKKILWREQAIESTLISDYAVSYGAGGGAGIMATKVAKLEAIKKASQDIAWTLRSRVLEGF